MSIKQQETRAEPQGKVPESPSQGQVEGAQVSDEEAPASDGDDSGTRSEERMDKAGSHETELAMLREELSAVNDKYLRKLAEDANFRKRMLREKEDGQRFAVSALIIDLIPILDDFDRAIASAEIQKDYGVLHDGVLLIRRQLGSVLETKYGLLRFESLGKPFDPNHHEAVAMVRGEPGDGDEAVVAEEFLPGYGLHDRILRTAKVRVRMPAPSEPASGPQEGAPNDGKDAN
jgi:molecular chaperone GrpE